MSNNDDELLNVWNKACNYYNVPEQMSQKWYNRIHDKLVMNSTNQRVYHNWNDMLLPKCNDLANCKPYIVLAAFFQYYEFDLTKSRIHENCQVFRAFCEDALIKDEEMINTVCYLLGEQTINGPIHESAEDDAAVLQDLDLVILAASPELYKSYAKLSRQEWCILGEYNYNNLRKKTLSALLALDIYKTPQFCAKYASKARKNIESELQELNSE